MTDRISTEELWKLLDEVTPGPWRKVFYGGPDDVGYTVDGVGYAFCDADANLIAAAPDLAAEVIRLREALEPLVKTDSLKDLSDEELIVERDAGSHHAGFILNARAVLNHKETK